MSPYPIVDDQQPLEEYKRLIFNQLSLFRSKYH